MAEPDPRLLEELRRRGRVAPPGGGGDDGRVLESRVSALEIEMREVKAILIRIEKRLDQMDDRLRRVELEVAEVKGRITQLPTMWQVLIFGSSQFVALAALLFGMLRFLPR